MTTAAEARTLRAKYKPDKVRLLFIGESPPTGPTYFYKANSRLYYATEKAFREAVPEECRGFFLDDFKRLGCYVEDLCEDPVDKLPDAERIAARQAGEPRLARRLRWMTPRAIIIVGITTVAPNIIRALRQAGLGDIEPHELPFPGAYHYGRYVRELAALLPSLLDGRTTRRKNRRDQRGQAGAT